MRHYGLMIALLFSGFATAHTLTPTPTLARAFCCRGSLAGVPLPQALDDAPLTQRHWLRDDVRQFDHAYKRVQAMQQRSTL